MSETDQYSIRDIYGNIYGPATAALLRQWVAEGRIISGMSIRGGGAEWSEVSTHPAVADLFQRSALAAPSTRSSAAGPGPVPVISSVGEMSDGNAPRTHGMAVASLIVGICAFVAAIPTYPFFCCCMLSIPLGIVGTILGSVALHQLKGNPDRQGKGLAIAGVTLSALALLFNLVVAAVVTFLASASGAFHFGP